jgi:predicted DNA-binding transcriptional regulator AlpA
VLAGEIPEPLQRLQNGAVAMTRRFIGYAEMKAKLGVSRTQIGRMVKDGKLPQPLRLGSHHTSRTVFWEHEVDAAMEALDSRNKRPD